MSNARIPATDWLLAETVRLHEERHGRLRDDETANVLARETSGGLAARLARRAAALPCASAVRADLVRMRRLLRHLSLLVVLLAIAAGALAALSSAQAREVDVLLAAASMLFLPGLMLLVWLAMMLLTRPGHAAPGLSSGLVGLGLRRLGPRLLSGPLAAETVSAGAGLLLTGPGRWLLGTLTHAFWAAYGLAALATLALLFSIAQYDLSWGTTLLSDDTVVELIQALGWLPASLGLVEPLSPEWILAGREGAESGVMRAEWARFLLVLVAVYGIFPRLVLMLACAGFATLGLQRVRLDTARPGYLRLAGALMAEGEVRIRGKRPGVGDSPSRKRPDEVAGPPLLVAVELERKDWPVPLPGVAWHALGRADTRSQRNRLLAAAESLEIAPPAVLAQCSALRTPDEGTGRFLSALADAAGTVLVIWLDEGDQWRERGGDLGEREADWRSLAERVGADLVVVDADTPEAGALAELYRALGEQP
ncbi:DUF2868 domain-containing protein [Wenzhouxiangella limi]|uniref:DUF2868 domain-containing protein n=1 Tax=Wenzhouxiangella limi TaxID=2707351 RepID=A0A845V3H8_9GAMM|nr:DUF2868 domain-containing protein [Wenzhouxiangella limi]NDY95776.1 DUF2868 domain-containing protein [Wenzhouxiangella limi]